MVPKKEPNTFRLINHLSFPPGYSLNNEIEESVSYSTDEDAIDKMCVFVKGTLLAKVDVKSAFRLLPVHPTAFNLLWYYWDRFYVFDKCLPMGCALYCAYFENVFVPELGGLF